MDEILDPNNKLLVDTCSTLMMKCPSLDLYALRKIGCIPTDRSTILDLSFKPRYLMTFMLWFISTSYISAAPHFVVCAPQIVLLFLFLIMIYNFAFSRERHCRS
jgi:hypothetical protein